MRYYTEDWAIKGKWKDFYIFEEVVNIPPLQKWGISGEEAWQIAERDTKRYELAATPGGEVLKTNHKADAGSGGKKGERRRGGEWVEENGNRGPPRSKEK